MTSGVNVGDIIIQFPTNIPLNFFAIWQMAAEGQNDKIASDMEVDKKKKWEQIITNAAHELLFSFDKNTYLKVEW